MATDSQAPTPHDIALLDTACAKTCGGKDWADIAIERAEKLGLPYQWVKEHEPFRFGPGKRISAEHALILPFRWGGVLGLLRISILPTDAP